MNKITIWPRNLTLRHIPWGNQIETDTCITLFIAALFAIGRTWKQPRCPSTDEWIKKCGTYTIKYYSVIKKNTFESVLMKWMNIKPIIWSEVSQKEKDKYNMLCCAVLSCSIMSDSLQPFGLLHTSLPCPIPSPEACSNSCPLSQWCHPTISFSVIPFSSCLQSSPASRSFLMS